MKTADLKSADKEALRSGIHARVFTRLAAGQWSPGSRLSIEGLAREFKVSPTPVREAMASLERTGLVQYTPNRGYVVAPPLSPIQISELIEARLILEKAALSRAIEANWAALTEEMEIAHQQHVAIADTITSEIAVSYNRMNDYFEADVSFHDTFMRHSRNRFLRSMHRDLGAHAHRMRATWARGPAIVDVEDTMLEHEAVFQRVVERNHDGALKALDTHLSNVRRRFRISVEDDA